MLDTNTLSALLARGKAAGADFAEVYAERTRQRSLRVVDGEVQEATSVVQLGAGIRLFFGHDVLYGYTNDVSDEGLTEVLDSLIAVKGDGVGRPDASGRGGLDLRRAGAGVPLPGPRVRADAHDKLWRLERLREADAGARIDPAIRQVEGVLREVEQEVLIANSDGLLAEDQRTRTRLLVQAIASDGVETQTGHHGPGLSVGLELLETYSPAEVGKRAAEIALTNLRARKAPAGTMPVVVGNGFGGVIFHESLGHLLETTAVARNASVLAGKLGEQVASPVITYVDDGTIPYGWGSTRIDDEGMPTERTVLIEKGVLKSYMVDRWGSLVTGYRPTGSGRRQDYTFAPTSHAQHLRRERRHAQGEALRGHRVRPLREGDGRRPGAPGLRRVQLRRRGGLHDPERPDRRAGARRDALGKGPDTIRKVVAVSNDQANEPGMCGSKSGSVPTEVGQPHILVSEIVVGGEA